MRRQIVLGSFVAFTLAACSGAGPSPTVTGGRGSPQVSASIAANMPPTASPAISTVAPSTTPSAGSSSSPAFAGGEWPTPYQLSFAPTVAMAVAVSELNMRAQPSTGSAIVELARLDDVVVVNDHPFNDGRYTWYYGALLVRGTGSLPALPANPNQAIDPPEGWIAFAMRDEPYLRRLAPRCPSTIDLRSVVAMLGSERIACFSGQSIELEGSLRCVDCGGTGAVGEPGWLANTFRDPVLWHPDGGYVSLSFPPAIDHKGGPGQLAVVRGHYDDDAAATCRLIDEDGRPLPVDVVIAMCRARFVVEAVTILGPDPSWEGV